MEITKQKFPLHIILLVNQNPIYLLALYFHSGEPITLMNIKANYIFVASEGRFSLITKFICENPCSQSVAGTSVK
jgi:hypothetical protein